MIINKIEAQGQRFPFSLLKKRKSEEKRKKKKKEKKNAPRCYFTDNPGELACETRPTRATGGLRLQYSSRLAELI